LRENDRSYQPHVDGLRAVAVLVVLLYHLGVRGFKGGFVGVDVFLVISGFLITRLIHDEVVDTGRFRFGRFYLRRLRRLVPAFLAALTLTTCASVLLLSPGTLRQFGAEMLASLFSASNIYFWLQADYFDVSAKLKPLLHTWSLGVEEQFYLIWPACLVLLAAVRRRWILPVAIAVLTIVSLVLNEVFVHGIGSGQGVLSAAFENGKPTIFFLLPFRVFEFMIGAALALVKRHHPKTAWVNDAIFGVGLALVAFAVTSFDGGMPFPSYYALVPCLGAAMLIWVGAHSRLSALLRNPVAVWIGLTSYSIYLFHWPAIVLFEYVAGPMTQLEKALVGGASIALGGLSYRFIEQPFRSGRVRLRWMWPVFAALLAVSLHLWLTNGWSWRVQGHALQEVRGGAAGFHREQYGGAGYAPGPVKTTAPPDIVLVGDSFGLHYAEGLWREIAEPRGLALYISAGTSCLNLPGFTRTTTDADWDTVCPEAVDGLRNIVRGSARPPVVVISHDWLYQLGQSGLLDEAGARIDRVPTFEDVVDRVRRLSRELGGAQIVVIGMVPTMHGLSVYEELTRPAIARRMPVEEVIAPRPLDPAYRAFNERMLAESRKDNAFIFLDPCDALCREGLCDGVDEAMQPLYSDGGHLSKVGSRRVIRAFAAKLNEVIDSRPASVR
jgi:peptidoglycan/LPS O-acetylase OafA/YrhL